MLAKTVGAKTVGFTQERLTTIEIKKTIFQHFFIRKNKN